MAEITLMHEDIYIYIDNIDRLTQHVEGSNSLTIINDATNMKVNYGEMLFTVTSGTLTGVTLSCNGQTVNYNASVSQGGTLLISLEDNYYEVNKTDKYLSGDRLELKDNQINTITVTISGGAGVNVDYIHNRVSGNPYDLMFCDSISIKTDFERTSYVNVHGKIRYSQNEKKNYSWDINGIWNSEEFKKFQADSFSIRLIDIDGGLLELLANCKVNSINKSSSDSSDYTYQISGTCEEIIN